MEKELNLIRENALSQIESSKDTLSLDDIRVKYLGIKGSLTQVL